MTPSQVQTSQRLLELLTTKLGSQIREAKIDLGDVVIRIPRQGMVDLFRLLKMDAELLFDLLLDVTVVDWMDKAEERFEVVYHLLSLKHLFRLRIKIWTAESKPEVDSLTSLWSAANFLEREAWDMYGVNFAGHPDQRRILMYDEFVGHPLRKDYPVQAKQPRIPLRSPEVRNTAVDMERPALVRINPRSGRNDSGNAPL